MTKKNRAKHIKGIVADARTLGVTHPHLWMVLKGKRESKSLKRRYNDLQKQKAKA